MLPPPYSRSATAHVAYVAATISNLAFAYSSVVVSFNCFTDLGDADVCQHVHRQALTLGGLADVRECRNLGRHTCCEAQLKQ